MISRMLASTATVAAAPLHYIVELAQQHRRYQARKRVIAIKDAYGI